MFPHYIQDNSSNEGIFNDKGIQIGSRVINNGTHNIYASAGGGVEGANVGGESGRINVI